MELVSSDHWNGYTQSVCVCVNIEYDRLVHNREIIVEAVQAVNESRWVIAMLCHFKNVQSTKKYTKETDEKLLPDFHRLFGGM